MVAGGKLPFLLGGEHSVSIGAVRAVRETHAATHYLAIDAHADLRDRYGGTDCSHACVTRRVHEGGAVTVLGVRSYSAAEAEYAARADDLKLVPARTALAAVSGAIVCTATRRPARCAAATASPSSPSS